MNRFYFLVSLIIVSKMLFAQIPSEFAPTPPMGWNSWNCFGLEVTEAQVKANVDYMAENMLEYGWEYVVIDGGWYFPPEVTTNSGNIKDPPMHIDAFGRLVPDPIKFPSAVNGVGFKALADYVHSKGLKFGIHIMRGIPWKAVAENTPILNSTNKASDVADFNNLCAWSKTMIGLKMNMEASKAYYNSLFELYAEWGVDFIKVDDVAREFHYKDMEAIVEAINRTGRPIIHSVSPGASPLSKADFFKTNTNLFRISNDFWDHWKFVSRQMDYCAQWYPHITPGHWPDADMLPFGKLRITGGDDWVASLLEDNYENIGNEYSRFTDVEKQTIFNLWSMFRSPLMMGGHFPETDDYTLSLLKNKNLIRINQHSTNNRLIKKSGMLSVWAANDPDSNFVYVAFFNLDNTKKNITTTLSEIGISQDCRVRELNSDIFLGIYTSGFTADIERHGSKIFVFDSNPEYVSVSQSIIDKANITIFPNPATEYLVINFKLVSAELPVARIYNMEGQLIEIAHLKSIASDYHQSHLHLKHYNNGMYIIRIDINGTISSHRFLVNKP